MPLYSVIAFLLIVILEILLFTGNELVKQYFYIFIWWSYIFFIDGLNKKRLGWSILTDKKRSIPYLIVWSVSIWLAFEIANLSLRNWYYINITSNIYVRWICYVLAYSTVLIGLFETYLFIKSFGLFDNIKTRLFKDLYQKRKIFISLGIVLTIFSLALPRYFFPFIWIGPFLVIDSLKIMKEHSIIAEVSNGYLGRLIQLKLAGLVCGFLWEFWNYWAGAKWVYDVPFVGDLKLFEMPVLGFLGFPPFMLECIVIYNLLYKLGFAIHWDAGYDNGVKIGIFKQLFFHIIFWIIAFILLDRFTVISFKTA